MSQPKIDKDYLIKSIRSTDSACYIFSAAESYTPSLQYRRWIQYRIPTKGNYLVRATGVVKRGEHESVYSLEEQEKKPYLSQAQSMTFIFEGHEAPVFGFANNHKDTLVGIMIPWQQNNVVARKLILEDLGTHHRPFDCSSWSIASNLHSKIEKKLYVEKEPFRKALLSKPSSARAYNEVLARIKWDCTVDAYIMIARDNFESRALSVLYKFAFEYHAQRRAYEMDEDWDKNYKIPIRFYIPGAENHLQLYEGQILEDDIEYAKQNTCLESLILLSVYGKKTLKDIAQLLDSKYCADLLSLQKPHIFEFILLYYDADKLYLDCEGLEFNNKDFSLLLKMGCTQTIKYLYKNAYLDLDAHIFLLELCQSGNYCLISFLFADKAFKKTCFKDTIQLHEALCKLREKKHYAAICRLLGFDFIRGNTSLINENLKDCLKMLDIILHLLQPESNHAVFFQELSRISQYNVSTCLKMILSLDKSFEDQSCNESQELKDCIRIIKNFFPEKFCQDLVYKAVQLSCIFNESLSEKLETWQALEIILKYIDKMQIVKALEILAGFLCRQAPEVFFEQLNRQIQYKNPALLKLNKYLIFARNNFSLDGLVLLSVIDQYKISEIFKIINQKKCGKDLLEQRPLILEYFLKDAENESIDLNNYYKSYSTEFFINLLNLGCNHTIYYLLKNGRMRSYQYNHYDFLSALLLSGNKTLFERLFHHPHFRENCFKNRTLLKAALEKFKQELDYELFCSLLGINFKLIPGSDKQEREDLCQGLLDFIIICLDSTIDEVAIFNKLKACTQTSQDDWFKILSAFNTSFEKLVALNSDENTYFIVRAAQAFLPTSYCKEVAYNVIASHSIAHNITPEKPNFWMLIDIITRYLEKNKTDKALEVMRSFKNVQNFMTMVYEERGKLETKKHINDIYKLKLKKLNNIRGAIECHTYTASFYKIRAKKEELKIWWFQKLAVRVTALGFLIIILTILSIPFLISNAMILGLLLGVVFIFCGVFLALFVNSHGNSSFFKNHLQDPFFKCENKQTFIIPLYLQPLYALAKFLKQTVNPYAGFKQIWKDVIVPVTALKDAVIGAMDSAMFFGDIIFLRKKSQVVSLAIYNLSRCFTGLIYLALTPLVLAIRIPLRLVLTAQFVLSNSSVSYSRNRVKELHKLCVSGQRKMDSLAKNPAEAIQMKESADLYYLLKQLRKRESKLDQRLSDNHKQIWRTCKSAFFVNAQTGNYCLDPDKSNEVQQYLSEVSLIVK